MRDHLQSDTKFRVTGSPILYFIFFLSGATGLVYEVIWVRLTGLVFGNTAHAIATVLGAFMAGLALGSWKLGQQADRVARPLKAYGILEIGIGISASLVPLAFRALQSFYWSVAPSAAVVPGGNPAVRFLTSFAVLLVPTFMMGGTLPMLTRFFTEAVSDVERKVGTLYALNTFGAASGTILAALYFIPRIGNTRTTLIIAAVNLLIGFSALALDRRNEQWNGAPQSRTEDPASSTSTPPVSPLAARLILLTLAVSGFVSMLYEVAWTRALAALMGSSTYAFSVMLLTFLTGIALGSTYVSRRRPAATIRLLGLTQLGIAFGGLVFLVGYVVAPYAIIAMMRAMFYSFPAVLTTQFVVCSLLMILATVFMGATFPIASQLYSSRLTFLGRSVGNIYSINTLGAIAGSLTAGFVLLPLIGTERTIVAGLFFNAAMSLLLLSEPSVRKKFAVRAVAVVLLLVATASMRGGLFWHPDLMDRGVLIYARQFEARPELTIAEHYGDTDMTYFKEGNNATISVRRGEDYVALRTNGKVDASNRDDMMTQLAISYLAGFFHPSPRTAMIIGYGSGVTVGAATTIPELESIDCIEIEPAVFGAAPNFADINRKSYENPKVHVTFDDARNFMNTTRKQYDIIISEPSNPWIAGVASLFTAEFYNRAAEVLKPDGVFVQWIQLYELDPEDLRMILEEFQRKFPEVSVWNTGVGDLILIGTRQRQQLDLARAARIYAADPTVARDFRNFLKLERPEGILAYFVMGTDEVRKFSANARRNTDDLPLLEFHAPRELFANTRDLNVDLLYDQKSGLIPPGMDIPDPEATYGAMIDPFLQMKRPNLANQAMAMLAQIGGDAHVAHRIALARLNLDSDELAAAESALKDASQALKPQDRLYSETEELWGVWSEKSGQHDSAIQHYKRAAEANPDRPVPLLKLSQLYGHDQNWNEAARWMEAYLKLEPRRIGHLWALLADYRLAANRPDDALPAFETSLRLDPYTYWARFRLARMFEDRNQTDEAVREYEFILKYSFDEDPDIYIRLANLYTAAGRKREAERTLEKGHRIFPTNAAIYRLYEDVAGNRLRAMP